MWNEIIRDVNLDGKYRCQKCGKDLEYAEEEIDFEYDEDKYKTCIDCL